MPKRSRRSTKDKRESKYCKQDSCALCFQGSDLEGLGTLHIHKSFAVHENCMYFSSALHQSFDPDDKEDQENHGDAVCGFLVQDIKREIRRSVRLKCAHCRVGGACSGCVTHGCPRSFHLPCALKSGALCVHADTFPVYCAKHRPKQDLGPWRALSSGPITCCVCLEDIPAMDDSILHGECCPGVWLHRDCVSQYVSSAGWHHVKCPLCSDKDNFMEVLVQRGIWIPDRDAAWESEPGAYRELYERTDPCSLDPCLCPHGPVHEEEVEGAAWEFVDCTYCGAVRAHRYCVRQDEQRSRHFMCHTCTLLVEANRKLKKRSKKKKKKKKKKERRSSL